MNCKDSAWAKTLAASMDEGFGRHNSSAQFRSKPWEESLLHNIADAIRSSLRMRAEADEG